jgi:hypothetical protein
LANAQEITLVINEFMADNTSVIADPSGKFEDWIEVYNFGDDPIDLGGFYFTDDLSNPKLYRIPVGNDSTIVQAKSYMVLWADDDWEEGVRHLEFKLSRQGEAIAIFKQDGETLIDSVSFKTQYPDKSYGRNPVNTSEWIYFDQATPGSINASKK